MSALVADALALTMIAMSKGSAGRKACTTCRHVTKNDSVLLAGSSSLVSIACFDRSKIAPHTDASMLAVAERLRDASATMSSAQLKELQTGLGWNYHPNMLLLSSALVMQLFSWYMNDWMHIYLVKGIANLEFGWLMAINKT